MVADHYGPRLRSRIAAADIGGHRGTRWWETNLAQSDYWAVATRSQVCVKSVVGRSGRDPLLESGAL